MAMVPWGIWAGSAWPAERTIGVCHSVRDTHAFLASLVGLPEERIAFRTAGFNHQCFVYVFRDRETGEDLYPKLRAIVDADPEGLGRRVSAWSSSSGSATSPPSRASTRANTCRGSCITPTRSSGSAARSTSTSVAATRTSKSGTALKTQLEAGEEIGLERNDELASQYLWALETGMPLELYGNVRNDDLIHGLPDDACVEVPVLVDKNGVQPTRIGEIPPQCLALNRTFLNVVELTVRAVVEGSRDLVEQAALLDPHAAATLTTQQIHDLVNELIEAHGELIPEAIRRG